MVTGRHGARPAAHRLDGLSRRTWGSSRALRNAIAGRGEVAPFCRRQGGEPRCKVVSRRDVRACYSLPCESDSGSRATAARHRSCTTRSMTHGGARGASSGRKRSVEIPPADSAPAVPRSHSRGQAGSVVARFRRASDRDSIHEELRALVGGRRALPLASGVTRGERARQVIPPRRRDDEDQAERRPHATFATHFRSSMSSRMRFPVGTAATRSGKH